ncbi:hypothetical protein RD792_006279 [Penstemon davidsonii]|uniref:Glutaredoxin domain-containing protein n=1 Tax=Penstemon davidsonii TaxID=160366 RepID=A0ABR0DCI7_9LAMI|nr:hypothetical protein RD792_006279 [Penstemon davidsonii]
MFLNQLPTSPNPNNVNTTKECNSIPNVVKLNDLKSMVEENAVIVFSKQGCCMSHVVKRLLHGLGANTPVYEVEEKDLNDVVHELEKMDEGDHVQFPVVFIGGRWFGGLDRVMAAHITGELTPLLKKAGALWL